MKNNFEVCGRVSLIALSALITFGCTLKSTATSNSSTTNVTTYHNDLARTGQNLNETILNRSNVNSTSFGKLASLPVDGLVYAQPLVLTNVQMGSSSKNLAFVVTEHDSVYAFDIDAAISASSPSTTPVWQRSFLGDSVLPCPAAPCRTLGLADTLAPNIYPEMGITSTPVIDQTTGTIYVVGVTNENGVIIWRLHALSISTGAEQQGSPVVISGALPGKAPDAGTDGLVHFQAKYQLSRAGLVLSNGVVYVAFTSNDDQEPTHGWVLGYDETSLANVSTFNTTPDTGEGTIWMAGGAPAVDDQGNLYAATSNSDPNIPTPIDLGESVIKLSVGGSSGMELTDYFTPYNRQQIAAGDVDLGSGGVLLLPDQPGSHPHLLVAGGKEGSVYLLDRDNLGKYSNASGTATSDAQIVQEYLHFFPGGQSGGPGIYGSPAYYSGNVYYAPSGASLTSIPVSGGLLNFKGSTTSGVHIKNRGGTPSISANGTSDGIVWYLDSSAYYYSFSYTPSPGVMKILGNGPAVLNAFSSDDVTTPLYQSPATSADPNAAGSAVKFALPTVANGLVYVGTQTEVSIYGLKDRTAYTPTPTPSDSGSTASNGDSSRSFASVSEKKFTWLDTLFAWKKEGRPSSFSF